MHVSNSFGTVSLNLAVKLVFSIVAACPLSMSDSGSLNSFQPSYITEAESQNPKNWSPPLQFYQFSSGVEDIRPALPSPTAALPKAACMCSPMGQQNNSFSSLTKITFSDDTLQFVQKVKQSLRGHRASLCQNGNWWNWALRIAYSERNTGTQRPGKGEVTNLKQVLP